MRPKTVESCLLPHASHFLCLGKGTINNSHRLCGPGAAPVDHPPDQTTTRRTYRLTTMLRHRSICRLSLFLTLLVSVVPITWLALPCPTLDQDVEAYPTHLLREGKVLTRVYEYVSILYLPFYHIILPDEKLTAHSPRPQNRSILPNLPQQRARLRNLRLLPRRRRPLHPHRPLLRPTHLPRTPPHHQHHNPAHKQRHNPPLPIPATSTRNPPHSHSPDQRRRRHRPPLLPDRGPRSPAMGC